MILYTVLSRLLDYPEAELLENIPLLHQVLDEERAIESHERQVLNTFLDHLQAQDLMTLQQAYVQTFDMVPEHSLHLTHHLFGDDRGRGPALVDLGEHYKGMGLAVNKGEIPDYLPLILEYVGTLDEMAARLFLADAAKVLTVLAANLEQSNNPYAPLLRLVEQRGRLAQSAA
jgi:nitrate reductase delta subunit